MTVTPQTGPRIYTRTDMRIQDPATPWHRMAGNDQHIYIYMILMMNTQMTIM